MGDGVSDDSDSEIDEQQQAPATAGGDVAAGQMGNGSAEFDDYYRFEIRMPGTSYVFRRKVK